MFSRSFHSGKRSFSQAYSCALIIKLLFPLLLIQLLLISMLVISYTYWKWLYTLSYRIPPPSPPNHHTCPGSPDSCCRSRVLRPSLVMQWLKALFLYYRRSKNFKSIFILSFFYTIKLRLQLQWEKLQSQF